MCKVWKPVLTLFVLLATCYSSMVAAQPAPRIVGGTIVPDDRYRFMASIYFDPDGDGSFLPGCGGSVIGSRWILTAAHCVINFETGEQKSTSEVAVLVGALDLTDDTQGTFLVAQNIYAHPDYSTQTLRSDIALIELPESLPTPVWQMTLPVAGSDVPIVDESAIVAGWGVTEEGGDSSSLLREVALPIVSHSQCLPFYADTLQLEANVCAGGRAAGGRDSCQGDSGGPLFVVRDDIFVQAGIVSYGEGCARPGIPGVYTRVSSYTDWVAGFVPDLLTSNGGSGIVDSDEVLDESGIIVLTTVSGEATDSASLLQGEVAIYEVTGATRVVLRSFEGDADLFISAGTNFAADDVLCISNTTELDSCELPDTSERLFATVYSYTDSRYSIAACCVSEDPLAGENTPIADPPVLEGPEVDEIPDQDEPANDNSPFASLTGDSSGGGSLGGLSLFILSFLVFARRRT